MSEYEREEGPASVELEFSPNANFNPIFWCGERFQRIESGGFYLSSTPYVWSKGWDAASVRSATWVRLGCRETGFEFLVANVHLDHKGRRSRIESSMILLRCLDRLQKERPCSIVLAGDFNSRAWAPSDERPLDYPPPVIPEALPPPREVYDVYLAQGFEDTFGDTEGLDSNTYHDYCGLHFPPTALRIDWILFRSLDCSLVCSGYERLRELTTERLPSDHYPVVAEFRKVP